DIISQNVANVNTTRTQNGGVYRRKNVVFQEKGVTAGGFGSYLSDAGAKLAGKGVKVSAVVTDNKNDMRMVYDPSHPDADENGYVIYPNVNIITEMTDLIDATRSYEANANAFTASKSMASKGLEIGG
ncbi:MAG TPA: flagellar basal body rod protein FlgC, partial [Eubacterium sp.]|nr:flagellar basal body rod protein FlgC [Eubacterium sp.]